MLYCLLTKSEVNRNRTDVEKHLDGRRFNTKLYQKWKKEIIKRKKALIFETKMRKKFNKLDKNAPKYRLTNSGF